MLFLAIKKPSFLEKLGFLKGLTAFLEKAVRFRGS